ncbi:MAG: hypothetical protein KG003_12450 [Bacteroidetes bacterium]|nr:hypothetical protein [Bacteroidota bacterium]
MFFHLMSCSENASVSLENLDDVAVHYSDGTILVEQSKSALAHNPLSDWSLDLWKTISNWLIAIDDGSLDVQKTNFRLYVTPPKRGNFCDQLHIAESIVQVNAITKEIKAKLSKRKTVPACIKYLEKFLDASEQRQFDLVSRFKVVNCDDDPLNAIKTLLAPTIPGNLINSICDAGIGMAKEQADRYIRKGHPANIAATEFRKNFHAFIQKNNLPGYLTSYAIKPETSELQNMLTGRPDFIKQLQFIESTREQQLLAVSDFLLTSANKVIWAEQGLVFDGSFSEWENDLLRIFEATKSEINETFSEKSDIAKGRVIYSRCIISNPKLDSREVPGHFTHGSFNALANDQYLGWHPQYLALLKKET